ncbi:MAG: hypothetical protein JST88_03825 [Bacteroidetes bacterium]|nr:hypothetical protein [Bacteroidota bacterium]
MERIHLKNKNKSSLYTNRNYKKINTFKYNLSTAPSEKNNHHPLWHENSKRAITQLTLQSNKPAVGF